MTSHAMRAHNWNNAGAHADVHARIRTQHTHVHELG